MSLNQKVAQPIWRVAALVAILALGLLLFAHVLPEHRVLSLKDAGHYFLDVKTRIADAFRAGHLPLWNERVACGVPLLADPVAQALYPGNVLFLLTSPSQGIKYFGLLHLMLSALALLALAREYGIGDRGALAGGLVLMGSGTMVSFHYIHPWTATLPWLLLSMALTRRLIHARGGGWSTSVVLAVALCLMHLGGAYELSLAFCYYVMAELVAALLTGVHKKEDHRHNLLQKTGFLALAGGLSGGLAALQLIPTLEMFGMSSRTVGVGGMEAAIWSLPPTRLLELAAPHLFGTPATESLWTALLRPSPYGNQPFLLGIYVGVPALALAAAGWRALPRRASWMLAGMTLITAVMSWGDATPVFGIAANYLPGVGLFRYPSKIFVLTMVALSLLAGAGVNSLLEKNLRARRTALMGAVILAVILIGCLALGLIYEEDFSRWLGEGIEREELELGASEAREQALTGLSRGALTAVAFLLVVMVVGRIHSRPGLAVLLTLLVLDLGLANRHLVVSDSKTSYFALPASFPSPQQLMSPSGETRVGEMPAGQSVLSYRPHRLSLLGYRCADGYGSMKLVPQFTFFTFLGRTPERILGFRSVRFAIEPTSDPTALRARRTEGALPRALVVPEAVLAINFRAAGHLLGSPEFNPRRTMVLTTASEEVLMWSAGWTNQTQQPQVRMLVDEASQLLLAVQSPAPGYLLLNDSWYPGWEATVNGQPASVLRANLMFRAVQIPAGHSQVEFSYQPKSLTAGFWVTGLSVTILFWILSLAYRSHRYWTAQQHTSGSAASGRGR